jgi:hypothetical protein
MIFSRSLMLFGLYAIVNGLNNEAKFIPRPYGLLSNKYICGEV